MTCPSDPTAVAWIGVVGAIIGSVATAATSIVNQCLQRHWIRRSDEPRRKLLRQMLNDPRDDWRELDTLRHVIGTDEEVAKRLLLDIGARVSENGKQQWGPISRNPLAGQKK